MIHTRHRHILPVSLGLTHGVADCISGYIIGTLTGGATAGGLMALIFVYNALAFGGQLPFGLILDRIGGARAAALTSVALIAGALLFRTQLPVVAVILAGIGSAVFHVAGGAATLRADAGKAAGPGLFAAPGVMGLALGGYLAIIEANAQWPLFAAMLVMGVVLAVMEFPALKPEESEAGETHGLEMHDLIMIGLLLAIAFRSAIWNIMSLAHAGDTDTLLLIGGAAMLGKIAGGFVADKVGWRNYAVAVLSLSVPALAFGDGNPILLGVGIALLQSATPVAIAGMHRAMPRSPATAAGVALGLGIAIGGIPIYSGLSSHDLTHPAVLLSAGGLAWLLYYFSLKRAAKIPLSTSISPGKRERKTH